MIKIGITSSDNMVGLSRDIALIKEVLGSHHPEFFPSNKRNMKKGRVLLHLEHVNGRSFRDFKTHFLIPNPEWFNLDWARSKERFSLCLCKTQDGVETFKRIGFRTKYIGFTSLDRYNGTSVGKKIPEFLHVAGKSSFKGTDMILSAWQPNFPNIHIYTQDSRFSSSKPNVRITYGRIPEDEFVDIQNRYLYQLCPSIAEGWGHYILEAMSTGSLVLTTDGPPMNEQVSSDFGWLVRFNKTGNFNLGVLYYADEEHFKENIKKMLACKDIEKRSGLARSSFLDKDSAFRSSFPKLIGEYL